MAQVPAAIGTPAGGGAAQSWKTKFRTISNSTGKVPIRKGMLVLGCLFLIIGTVFQFMLVQDYAVNLSNRAKTFTDDHQHDSDRYQKYNDSNCIFRNSPLYRKVYVYPEYGDISGGWQGSMLSDYAQNNMSAVKPWPWLDRVKALPETFDENKAAWVHQYRTEYMVRDLMMHPDSCLRTYDPEEATLFYVPYDHLLTVGMLCAFDFEKDPTFGIDPAYAHALDDLISNKSYDGWERLFGLTSKYWKRRDGSDHIIVHGGAYSGFSRKSAPNSNWNSNWGYIENQKSLSSPIVISTELSASFVERYPMCTAKNILIPDVEFDGGIYNGKYDQIAMNQTKDLENRTLLEYAVHPGENRTKQFYRPSTEFFQAGLHGMCRTMRYEINEMYNKCSRSSTVLQSGLLPGGKGTALQYKVGPRLSTFCICTGGDSPFAKRNSDAILAGCIPVVLATDVVWPFTSQVDPMSDVHDFDFSLRLPVNMYDHPVVDFTTCRPYDEDKPTLEMRLRQVPTDTLQRLKQGVAKMKPLYAWYEFRDDLPEWPIKHRMLPDGGLAHAVVQALADRAEGVRWPACKEEVERVGIHFDEWRC